MKKRIISLFLLLGLSTIVACGNNKETVDSGDVIVEADTIEQESTAEKEVEPEETTPITEPEEEETSEPEYETVYLVSRSESNGELGFGLFSHIVNEYEYDADGNKIRQICYGADDSISVIYEYEYEYDDNGELSKRIWYNEDGEVSIIDTYQYEYDENGNKIKQIDDTGKGLGDLSNYTYCEIEYDEDGNAIHLAWLDDDGNVVDTQDYEHEFDSNGNVIKETVYRGDGSIRSIYEYDEHGNVLIETSYDEEGGESTSKYEYEYDEHGNIIKETLSAGSDGLQDFVTDYEYITMEVLKK